MSQPFTYKLKTPIELGTETITEVTIGKIKGKHMRSLPANPSDFTMDVLMNLASKVTAQSGAVFDEMGSEDLVEVLGIVGERLGAGQGTGGKP